MGFGTGGFSIGGIPFGGSDALSRRTVRRRGLYAIENYLDPIDREQLGKAQREFEAVPGTIQEGYKLARREATDAFRGAQRSALDQGRIAEGDALSRLTDTGFSGAGSIGTNLRLGIGYGTSRAIQDIQDRVAQIGANLGVGEAQDVASARAGLGRFYMQRRDAERQNALLRYGLYTGAMPQPASEAPTNLDDTMKFLASLFGGGG